MSQPIAIRRDNARFLGVDGGGSKTLAIVVDAQGRERGRGLAGSSNYNAVGLEQAVGHLRAAVEQAVQSAGGQLPLEAAWIGLSGVDRPADYDILLPQLQPLARAVRVTNDAELLLSALADAVGVALVAGTGSIALGRDTQGTLSRAGGWGHVLGDEGSGYDLGRQALQAATRAADGRGEPTALLGLILQHWKLERASEIIAQVYPDEDKAKVAQLSALVFAAARSGDELARKLLRRAAGELALAALTVAKVLTFPDGRVPLALGGGLLLHEPIFCRQILQRIRRRRPLGCVVMVEQPALSAAQAAISLTPSSVWSKTPEASRPITR